MVAEMIIEQGFVLKVENINFPVLVVSRTYFNKTEQVIVCPIKTQASLDPLHINISTRDITGVVLCEQLKLLDLRSRGYKKLAEISNGDTMNITDAIQGIFDYYPFGK